MPIAKGFAIKSGITTRGVAGFATGSANHTANPTATDTVTIGQRTYTYRAALTGAAYEILIGGTPAATATNLKDAINGGAGEGTTYGVGTFAHEQVTAAIDGASADKVNLTAKDIGSQGNSIVTTSTGTTPPTMGGATLTGGTGGLWQTAYVIGANEGLELKTEGVAQDSQLINSDGATGARSRGSGDRGNEFHAGDATFDMKYRGLETLIALAFGQAGAPVQQGGDVAYRHVFQDALSLEGLMGTLVFDKTISIWEYPSVKVNSLTMSIQAGGIMELTVSLISSNLNRNTTGGVNNRTTVVSITVPTERHFVLFEHLHLWMAPQAEAAFNNVLHLVYCNSFSVTMTNNQASDDVTTRYGRTIDEATEDGFFEVTGEIGFSKYQEERFVDASQTKAKQMIKAQFGGTPGGGLRTTAPFINGATRAEMTLYFPEAQIATASPNSGGPGRVGYTAAFTAAKTQGGFDPAPFPTGYGAHAVNLELVNGRNTDVLNPLAG